MKVLIYGHKGWIGNMFYNYLKHNTDFELFLGEKRLDNYNDVLNEINIINPDSVLSFTGRTHGVYDGKLIGSIDYLEMPEKLVENMRDNFIGPINIAQICEKLNKHYVYLGTGCIYTYTNETKIFDDDMKPNFFGSSYSIVKGYTDQEIRKYKNTLNLRIRMPISYENNSRNFIDKIVSYKNICSMQNSMTVLEDMFPIISKMIMLKTTGSFNMTNPGTIEHNEILEMYKKYIDNNHKWNSISYEEQKPLLKSERSNNELDSSKLLNFCINNNIELKNIKDSVSCIFESKK